MSKRDPRKEPKVGDIVRPKPIKGYPGTGPDIEIIGVCGKVLAIRGSGFTVEWRETENFFFDPKSWEVIHAAN
jgi:hypothetical protein